MTKMKTHNNSFRVRIIANKMFVIVPHRYMQTQIFPNMTMTCYYYHVYTAIHKAARCIFSSVVIFASFLPSPPPKTAKRIPNHVPANNNRNQAASAVTPPQPAVCWCSTCFHAFAVITICGICVRVCVCSKREHIGAHRQSPPAHRTRPCRTPPTARVPPSSRDPSACVIRWRRPTACLIVCWLNINIVPHTTVHKRMVPSLGKNSALEHKPQIYAKPTPSARTVSWLAAAELAPQHNQNTHYRATLIVHSNRIRVFTCRATCRLNNRISSRNNGFVSVRVCCCMCAVDSDISSEIQYV